MLEVVTVSSEHHYCIRTEEREKKVTEAKFPFMFSVCTWCDAFGRLYLANVSTPVRIIENHSHQIEVREKKRWWQVFFSAKLAHLAVIKSWSAKNRIDGRESGRLFSASKPLFSIWTIGSIYIMNFDTLFFPNAFCSLRIDARCSPNVNVWQYLASTILIRNMQCERNRDERHKKTAKTTKTSTARASLVHSLKHTFQYRTHVAMLHPANTQWHYIDNFKRRDV